MTTKQLDDQFPAKAGVLIRICRFFFGLISWAFILSFALVQAWRVLNLDEMNSYFRSIHPPSILLIFGLIVVTLSTYGYWKCRPTESENSKILNLYFVVSGASWTVVPLIAYLTKVIG